MTERLDVAVVGAGPFGLSAAAWLPDRRVRVFGEPMRTWRTVMPPDMLMRSAWEETSLSARSGAGSIDEWAAATGERKVEPLPLATFLRYADWFRERFVPDHDEADVALVARAGRGFRIETTAGAAYEAAAVVLAVGVTPFPYAPPPFAGELGDGIAFAVERQRSFESLTGLRVAVVGAGQAGLESAGLAARAGAQVEVLARSEVRWFADREPHHERGPVGNRLYRLAYPAVGYGPPPLNRLVLHPDLFARLPVDVRRRLTSRLLRPGGSPWVRSLVEGHVRLTEGRRVTGLDRADGALRLRLDDGTAREVDAVLLATGYRFSLERLGFLAPDLRAGIALEDGFPRIDRGFRTTVPGLLVAGFPAEGLFGPLSRFVLGTGFTARRLRRSLVG